MDTCKRWIRLFKDAGRVFPKRDTGNHIGQREVHGIDLVNLATFRLVHPKAYIDEVRAYINNQNSAARPYSPSQIVRAEQRLCLWQKVRSATSNQAYRPVNLSKCKDYWEELYPAGVNDQAIAAMIDIDEAGFKLESQDRKRGKVTKQRRADARGKYKKGGRNVSLLMGISGNQQNSFKFHQLSEGGNQ